MKIQIFRVAGEEDTRFWSGRGGKYRVSEWQRRKIQGCRGTGEENTELGISEHEVIH